MTIDTAARGPIRLLLPLLRRQFRANTASSLRRIKQMLESGPQRGTAG